MTRLRLLLLAAGLLCAPAAAWAQSWQSGPSDRSASRLAAGYAVKNRFDFLFFACGPTPGSLDLVVSGLASGLAPGAERTVVASVDGTAYVEAATAAGGSNGIVLARRARFTDFAPLIEALKKGRSVEVSGPDGRVTLPLKGSGKALAALQEACG